MVQWSKTTSHFKRGSNTMLHGKLRSYRGSRLVKFVLWIFINFTDIHETGESSFFIFFILTFFTYSRRNSDSRKGRLHLTVTSLQCQCRHRAPDTTGHRTPLETHDRPCNPLDSEIPEWPQEFRENLVDDEISAHGDSHASSSHEASLEPTTKRREDLGKHNVHTHFPKDRNCEICKRTKITRAPCRRRNGEAVPRADNFGDLITADHKVVSDNCQSPICSRGAGSSYSMDPGVPVQKTKLHKKPREACKSSWSLMGSLKSFTLTIPWNSAKLVKIFSWNHCTSTPHRSETNRIAERAVRRVKEGTSAVLLQSSLNESRWADSMECDTYLRNVTDLLSDGKTPYERRFGQPC